ncbi:tail completion protein gp17 [Paenirhodobacter populi]|uniref:DUF3168 domain-containing protein n=1 Tax=Paenirhodobacter populi TaxID=2306993 RepID=A0A443JKN2_9RHOB|nr:DUF3168 domain-containing protein [Sinirhodobacter populi]RWR21132.1 DUF3168 domain-containing protein [Sinirhodobacter populi]
MTDPTIALQNAIASALIADPVIAAHVAPERIRASGVRPEEMPSLLFSPSKVTILGHASGGQIVAEVRQTLHLWVVQDGTDTAQEIANAVLLALMDAPVAAGVSIDAWDRPVLAWASDPDPAQSFVHGAFSLNAVLRWRV